MALRFYFDTHIAKVAALQLRAKGVDVLRCEDVGMTEASDKAHLIYATEHERIMVSQDEDFPILDARWKAQDKRHMGIFKIPPTLKGMALISAVVNELIFYDEAATVGAIDYLTEIENTVVYLRGK